MSTSEPEQGINTKAVGLSPTGAVSGVYRVERPDVDVVCGVCILIYPGNCAEY